MCLDNPCMAGVTCTDKTTADHLSDGTGYTCGPCPAGYESSADSTSCIGKLVWITKSMGGLKVVSNRFGYRCHPCSCIIKMSRSVQ